MSELVSEETNTSCVGHDWADSVIICQYERYGGKAYANAPAELGFMAFSNGFWVDERGLFSGEESIEWVSPDRILVIFRERSTRPSISSNVAMVDR